MSDEKVRKERKRWEGYFVINFMKTENLCRLDKSRRK